MTIRAIPSPTPSPRPRIRFMGSAPSSADDRPRSPEQPPAQARITAEAEEPRRKRQPNKGSFKEGESGNPKGRPRGAKGAKAMVRNILGARTTLQIGKGEKRVAIFEALVRKEVSLAAEGDWRARRTVFELGKWALGESSELPLEAGSFSPEELTATGQAILDWFADEIRQQDQTAGDDQ